MSAARQSGTRPRITILAASGPLAGDVAACLSGRFSVEQVVRPTEGARAVANGTRALIILDDSEPELGDDMRRLVRQAVAGRCRVLILGQGGLGPDDDPEAAVVRLPHLPSPQQLIAALAGLADGQRAGEA